MTVQGFGGDMVNNRHMVLATCMMIAMAIGGAARSQTDPQKDPQKARPRTTASEQDNDKKKPVQGDRLEPDEAM